LKERSDIEIHLVGSRELAIARKPSREQLLKQLRTFRGRLPADFKFDREDANAR
jgi:antitoxin MazE